MAKTKLLLLVHRIPYPPNKGDKIRSFNLLRHLAAQYDIHLGAFVDDPADLAHLAALDGYCKQVKLLQLRPSLARWRSLRGLLEGSPLTVPYYRDAAMQRWVAETVAREGIDHILVYSSAMAQFVTGPEFDHCRRVIDFVDVDSDKWQQYAHSRGLLSRWLYRRESKQLLCYERKVAAAFDASVFVSDAEAALFRELAPRSAHKVFGVANGVDLAYFDPTLEYQDPYPADCLPIVFTGAMDYWPNVDAVVWFVRRILPQLREQRPAACFYIVGANPSDTVQALAREAGVAVTGRVADVRPYVRHATVSVAPMRLARGIQNKVLESMALGRPTVVTPAGAEGIAADIGREFVVAESAQDFTQAVLALLDDPELAREIGEAGRRRIARDYPWSRHLARFDTLLGSSARRQDLPPTIEEVAGT